MIRVALLGDGSSDRVLQFPLRWLFKQLDLPAIVVWADLQSYPVAPKSLKERVAAATHLYTFDLLVVHRDAEAQSPEIRRAEIAAACQHMHKHCACQASNAQ